MALGTEALLVEETLISTLEVRLDVDVAIEAGGSVSVTST